MKKNKNLLNAKIIKTKKFQDHRGKFNKYFSMAMYPFFKKEKISIEEINYCFTKKRGTIRGLHFQAKPFEEDKIVLCLKGKVFDVAIDVRKNSRNFLNFDKIILSEHKTNLHFIPRGYAHGYQTLTDNCELLYLHTNFYSRTKSKSVCPIQSKININWPIKKKIISNKDKLGIKY